MKRERNIQIVLPRASQVKGKSFEFDFTEVDLMCLHVDNHYHMIDMLNSCMDALENMDIDSLSEQESDRVNRAMKFLEQELESLRITSITRNNVVRL